MQYPQIQFYRGSLVRLGSGRLKQVEDLSSDDFLESARFISGAKSSSHFTSSNVHHSNLQLSNRTASASGSGPLTTGSSRSGSKNSIDENNNSVFSSPQLTSSSESPNFDMMEIGDDEDDEEDDDEELDVVSDEPKSVEREPEICIESSVVRDFLEIGTGASSPNSPFASTSFGFVSPKPQTGICSSVLVKFFLESSRTVVFTEVPSEHPFFVFHRGWSSWNPQLTFEKFGLKCRKLKIGDTCISLIRRQSNNRKNSVDQQDSDHCNFLFSSININE